MRRKGVKRSRSSGSRLPHAQAERRGGSCRCVRHCVGELLLFQEPVRAIGGFRTMESGGARARRRHLIGPALLTPLLPRAPLRKWSLLSVFDFVGVRRPRARPPPMCGDRAFASGASLPLSSPLLLAPSPRAWMCGSVRGYERTPWRSALGQQNSAGSACEMCVGSPCGRGRWAHPGLRGSGCAGMYVYVVPRC